MQMSEKGEKKIVKIRGNPISREITNTLSLKDEGVSGGRDNDNTCCG